MKRLTLFRLSFFALLCCTLAIASCSDADVPANGTDGDGSANGKYISISVSAGASATSRATLRNGTDTPPNGGEDGDGNESGNANESTVSKVSILLYQAPEGVTIPEEGVINVAEEVAEQIPVTVFCWNTYLKSEGVYTTGSRALNTNIALGTYRIVVVANTDLSGLNGRSLAYVRNYVVEKEPFDRGNTDFTSDKFNPSSCTDFLMSSYKEQTLIIGNATGHCGSGTPSDPYVVTTGAIELERLAARIDYATSVTNDESYIGDAPCVWNAADETYDYAVWRKVTVTDEDDTYEDYERVATFKLKYVVPFNLTQHAYLFKHTTTGTDLTTCNYMGRETDDTQTSGSWIKHYNTNYVLDPFTLKKGDINANFSNFYISEVYHHSLTDHAEKLMKVFKVKPTSAMSYDATNGRNYYTLGYSAENTVTAAAQQSVNPGVSSYVAGIRFFGRYVRGKYNDDGQFVDTEDASKAQWKAYDWYIRHSAPDGTADLTKPMTFGLVRNNIYRVYINSVSQIAGEVSLDLKISCIPWQKYEHDEIVM